MKHLRKLSTCLFLSSAMLCSSGALAEDISHSVRGGASIPADQNGGFLDLGLGLAYFKSPLWGYPEENISQDAGFATEFYLNINGRYQYKGFFIEAYAEGINGFNMGYNLISESNWSVDIIGAPVHFDMGDDDDNETWKNSSLQPREADFSLGLRANYSHPEYMIEVRALQDISDTHDGNTISTYVGKNWQKRNLNLHLLAGVAYHSRHAGEYYFNVKPEEASEQVPEYSGAKAGFVANAEFGLTYPIRENWVWRGLYRYTKFMSGITDSPLLIHDEAHIFSSSVSYVF
ncbi:MltA-interacting MipA family protein [Catenovulum agarivorans DS-2]|uniref:MltA-interacting MipA family protein n=1 Tax=Catenovulum agarivorans DS-2 TaxID=1328313 RepID=W7QHG1_9ALTE|nr:MipA/OmpV family protein [Catenovulum agarivorans]EWH08392.1 MltA-interacting MipA family protein [Catenovulum agarivorans DS-2]